MDRLDSVGERRWGDDVGMAYLVAALALGIHEAWTQKRGVLGWIVNIVVSLVGAFVAAPLGGMVIVMLLSDGSRRWRPQEVFCFPSRSSV